MRNDFQAKLSFVQLQAPDIRAVKEWYVKHLGLMATFELGSKLVILSTNGMSQLGFEQGPPVSEPERVDLIFEVPDVDVAYRTMFSAGVPFVRPPVDEPYGHRVAILNDPVGHKVEIFAPIKK